MCNHRWLTQTFYLYVTHHSVFKLITDEMFVFCMITFDEISRAGFPPVATRYQRMSAKFLCYLFIYLPFARTLPVTASRACPLTWLQFGVKIVFLTLKEQKYFSPVTGV